MATTATTPCARSAGTTRVLGIQRGPEAEAAGRSWSCELGGGTLAAGDGGADRGARDQEERDAEQHRVRGLTRVGRRRRRGHRRRRLRGRGRFVAALSRARTRAFL